MFDNFNQGQPSSNDFASSNSSTSPDPDLKEGLFLAENLLDLYVKKKRLEKEIERCRKLVVESTSRKKEVYELKDGASVRISQSKLGFSASHTKFGFENIPITRKLELVQSNIIKPVEKISLNEHTLSTLPEDKLNELIEQNILQKREVLEGNNKELAKIDSKQKTILANEGIISLPEPKVRVYATKLLASIK